jgi:hypothetical protein
MHITKLRLLVGTGSATSGCQLGEMRNRLYSRLIRVSSWVSVYLQREFSGAGQGRGWLSATAIPES